MVPKNEEKKKEFSWFTLEDEPIDQELPVDNNKEDKSSDFTERCNTLLTGFEEEKEREDNFGLKSAAQEASSASSTREKRKTRRKMIQSDCSGISLPERQDEELSESRRDFSELRPLELNTDIEDINGALQDTCLEREPKTHVSDTVALQANGDPSSKELAGLPLTININKQKKKSNKQQNKKKEEELSRAIGYVLFEKSNL